MNRCNHTIKSLHSSSNYMGYDMLCKHYSAWMAKIDAAEKGLSADEETELDFMKMYLDEIIRVYPQTAAVGDQQQAAEPPVSAEDDHVAGPGQDNLDQTLDVLFGDSFEEPAAQEQDDDIPVDKEPEGLIAALSDAFDETTETATPTGESTRLENETLDEEYDEKLLDIFMNQLKRKHWFLAVTDYRV